MSDLRTSIILSMTGNVGQQARTFGRDIEQMGARGSRAIGMMSRSMAAIDMGFDRMFNRYTALIFGAGGIGTIRMVGNLQERFMRLGNAASISGDQLNGLKNSIFRISQLPDIRIDPSQLTSSVEAILESTGDLKFAEGNLKTLATAIQATGAEGKSIGQIAVEFQKMGITKPKDMLEAFDILNVQGKEGAFTLKELAGLGPRVVSAYKATGRTGLSAVREMGAALQSIRKGTENSDRAATAFEAMLGVMGDAEKIKKLTQGGIVLFDPEKLKKGERVLRPINELMVEIVKKTKGQQVHLSTVFDRESMRAFNSLSGEFLATGKVESIKKFYDVQADGTSVLKDSAAASKTLNAALINLKTAWLQFADHELTGPIGKLAGLLNSLGTDTVQRWMEVAKWIGMIGVGTYAVRKILPSPTNTLLSSLGAGLGSGGGPGGVVPVFVVNSVPGLGIGALGGTAARAGVSGIGAAAVGASGAGATGLIGSVTSMGVLAQASIVAGAALMIINNKKAVDNETALIEHESRGYKYTEKGISEYIDKLAERYKKAQDIQDAINNAKPAKGELTININSKTGEVEVKDMFSENFNATVVDNGRIMHGAR